MARAYQVSPSPALGHDPNKGEWQALRGELVALLDHVEGHFVRPGQGEPEHDRLALRLKELRQQVEPEPLVRRQEALRSVQRAVDRFNEKEESATPGHNPRDMLQSAIQEIRSKQSQPITPVASYSESSVPRFSDMASTITGMSGRLERLESELNSQGQGSGKVHEIADQVAQLSNVIELLAGAVGESGQVKRLEAQIASLTQLITANSKPDISVLSSRIDLLGRTIEKLTKLQGQGSIRQAEQASARDADLKRGILGIEEGIRNVYDRLDAVERNSSLPQAEVDKLASGMASVSAAVSKFDFKPQELVKRIEDLHARLADMEKRGDGNLTALKSEISALKQTVTDAMAPRFAAIENRLDALGSRLAESHKPAPGVAAIEDQLKKLVTRMDEAGSQLTGLTKLYKQPDTKAQPAPPPLLNDAGIAELEKRLAKLLASGGVGDSQGLAQVEDGIRKVDERLDRLEATLARLNTAEASRPQSAAAVASSLVSESPVALKTDKPAAKPEHHEAPAPAFERARDAMPRNPSEEAPLTDTLFIPPMDSGAKAEAGKGPIGSVLGHFNPGSPKIDEVVARLRGGKANGEKAVPLVPQAEARPPRPHSSLTDPVAEALADHPLPAPEPVSIKVDAKPTASASTRNTFIEAHRRAQRQKAEAPSAAANSVIGRALARFHNEMDSRIDLPEPLAPAQTEIAKPGRPAKKAEAPAEKPARGKATVKAKEADDLSVSIAAEIPEALVAAEAQARDSFLKRHRRALLLSVALVAVSMLTLNLITQRLAKSMPGSDSMASMDASSLPAAEAGPAALPIASKVAAALGGTPDGGIAIDETTVGAIQPASLNSVTQPVEVAAMPDALYPVALNSGNLEPEAINSPVEVELPPEALGPLALREAAAKGDARAQFEVAAIYTEGRSVPQDYKLAAKWYERAAAQGFAPAQYRLASLYETGTGVEKNLEQARLWYQRAAEAGNRMSMHNLAALYAGGQLGKQEFASAAEWFEQAAMRGMTDSQFNLGMLYARGLGVDQDFAASYKWFSLAASHGDADAMKARDDVAKSIDPADMGALNQEIAAWKPTQVDLAANFAPIGTWSDAFDPGAPIDNQDVVKKVQAALVRLGYDVGTPDGMSGPKTVDAIKAFEKGTGMSETGTINPRLLAVLGSQPV